MLRAFRFWSYIYWVSGNPVNFLISSSLAGKYGKHFFLIFCKDNEACKQEHPYSGSSEVVLRKNIFRFNSFNKKCSL